MVRQLLTSVSFQQVNQHWSVQCVQYSERVTTIGEEPLYVKFDPIIIPSVTSIGNNAFDRASNLTSVTFEPNSRLTSIGRGAFQEASSLTSIHSSRLNSIGQQCVLWCDIFDPRLTYQKV